jgi:hypothetical protein
MKYSLTKESWEGIKILFFEEFEETLFIQPYQFLCFWWWFEIQDDHYHRTKFNK